MEAVRATAVTVILSEQEAFDIAGAITEALWCTQQPQADGFPFNWKSNPGSLSKLYNLLKPDTWGEIS